MIPLLLWLMASGDAAHPQVAPGSKAPVAIAQAAKVSPGVRQAEKVSAAMLRPLEKGFNSRLMTLFEAGDPLDLLGPTRGVYLEGFGPVFTAEVSLVTTPSITPFRQKIPKEIADSIHERKVQRLPFLKAAMKEMLRNMAATFPQLPEETQMVLVVRFWYEPWEELNGMPSQVMMRASRKDALNGDVKVEDQ